MNTAPTANAPWFQSPRLPRPPAPRAEPDAGALLGRVLENRYLTEELLEQSAASQRYRAYDMATDEMVTVEVLPRRSLREWPRVRQAVTRMAAHGHPHVAALLARGVFEGRRPYLVFEMHGDRTLEQLLEDEAPLELGRALRIAIQCSRALGAVHQAGLVHLGLSPRHVRTSTRPPGLETVKIDGFGLAPLLAEVSPAASDASGGVATDIYDLGEILRALTLHARSLGLPQRIVERIAARCLAEEPCQRYPSAARLCSDLLRLEAALDARETKHAHTGAHSTRPAGTGAKTSVHSPPSRSAVAMGPALPKVIVAPGA
jgi:serine/threonine protein kinase